MGAIDPKVGITTTGADTARTEERLDTPTEEEELNAL